VPNAITAHQRDVPIADIASPHAADRGTTRAARRGSLRATPPTGCRAFCGRAAAVACFALGAVFAAAPSADAADTTLAQAREIEAQLFGYPKRAQTDLAALVARADTASAMERRYVYALYGQAMVAAGRNAEALAFADRLEREAGDPSDDLLFATARLVRGTAEWRAGDAAKANTFAKEARALLKGASDPYLMYWAAMTIGVTARSRGQLEEAVGSLQDALSMAERDGNAYRRSSALYQLSNLYLALKQPQNALDASRQAYQFAERAGSTPGMVKARMAESAALEILEDPVRELAAMEEALALARKSQSQVGESLALINLADIRLRRKEFNDALDLSRRSLALAIEFNDVGPIATSKANIGFALFGLGRAAEGKRFADEALAEYERTGATAEIASLLGEYGHYLEKSGDYKTALAFYHRERKLYEEMAAAAHQQSVLELQEKYESERSRREIELLNRQNALNSARLENQALRERVWWLFTAVFVISLVVVAVFYRKLRVNNGLLRQKNRELSVRSSRDPLTALYNRRFFQDFMRDAANRPERRRRGEADAPIHALLLIDIDLFKQTNDRYGHAAGDAVLVVVARRLRETLRETDMIVRWGGEEFLVFVPATSAGKLDEIAARVMAAIASEPIVYQGNCIRVTASIGYAPMPLPPENIALPWERAISLVDMALYMAKLHGRNCAYGIRRLRRSDDEAMARIERDLQSAWANGMVEMHLEPGPSVETDDVAELPWSSSQATA
jgi:diguanylate cyclase (GGDEF)-like protein